MALGHKDIETVNLGSTILLKLYWLGLGDEISNWLWGMGSAQVCTALNKCRVCLE